MRFTDLVGSMQTYAAALEAAAGDPAANTERKLCRQMLELLSAQAAEYDPVSSISKANWGNAFEQILSSRSTNREEVQKVLYFLAQVAREHTLRSALAARPAEAAILEYVSPQNRALDSQGRQLADYIWNGLLRDVVREDIARNEKRQKEFDARIEGWQKSLTDWEQKVLSHQGALKNLHQRYNFVELSKAFAQMYESKRTEKNIVLRLVIVFGALLTLPLFAQLPVGQYVWGLSLLRVEWTAQEWAKVIPLAALEVVALYFFRIFLRNYYATKGQLLQLDLRQALCAFIETYVEFAKEKGLASKDASPLSKFEGIVFSGLPTDTDDVPSSIEFFDHLVKAAKDIKKA